MTDAKIYDAHILFRYHKDEMDSDIELRRKGIKSLFAEYNELRVISDPTQENLLAANHKAWEMLRLSEEIINIEIHTVAALARLDEILYPDNG